MKIFDISRELVGGMAVWPGDTPYSLASTAAIASGAAVNVSQITMSSHTGTHVDAPRHFTDEGETAAILDPRLYWGPAQVVTVEKEEGALAPADFERIDLSLAPRLLIHSAASAADPNVFPSRIVYPAPELAPFLAEKGIVLFGSDAPSMDHLESKKLPGHHALWRAGIAILEGLVLTGVPDGVYELAAVPLKIVDGDGSPVRALLRTLS